MSDSLLPLTPFEEYLFTDDLPAYPINCHIRFRFRGRFDRPALDSALREMLTFHPLLRSGVQEVTPNDFRWFPFSQERWPTIQWLTETGEVFPPGRKFNLAQDPGVRLCVVERPDNASDLFVEFHHAVADGIGMFGAMEDLFDAYQGNKEAAARIDPKRLAKRDPKIPSLWTFYRGLPWWCRATVRFLRLVAFRPVAFLRYHYGTQALFEPNVNDPEPTLPFPAIVTNSLSREETQRLRQMAKETGATLYEWMLMAYYRSIDTWIRELGFFTKKRCLRVAVPVSLRTPEDTHLSASNVVSMVFIDRFRSELSDKQRLLHDIHREMTHLKHGRMGHLLPFLLRIIKRFQGSFHWVVRKRSWASTVFTHLGRLYDTTTLPLRDGKVVLGNAEQELILDEIHATPPIRPWYVAVLGTGIYAGSLSMTLHYDAQAISREHAGLLLQGFEKELGVRAYRELA